MPIVPDQYGFCCICHRNLRYEQVISDKVMMRFDTDYDETEYLLNDGSKMRVAICKPCKEKLTEEHHTQVMDCVKAGWVEEVKTLPWSDAKKKDYLDTYNKKEIVCFSDNVPDDVLKQAGIDYNVNNVEKEVKENGSDFKTIHI